jgi:hypothetical protein
MLHDSIKEEYLQNYCNTSAENTPVLSEKPPKLHPKPICIESNRDTLNQLVYGVYQFTDNPKPDKYLICPLVFDTEYTQPVITEFLDHTPHIPPRLNLTVQVKHPLYHGEIFLHPDLVKKPLPDYTVITRDNLPDWGYFEDLAFIDYLKRLGFDCDVTADYEPLEKDNRPVFIFKIYAHFLIADISTIGGEWWHGVVRELYKQKKLTMDRRATIQSGDFKPPYHTLDGNINFYVQGVDYRLGVQIIDTIALQGNVSLAEMASNVGVEMSSKNDLDHLKTRMDKALIEHTQTFEDYALGDLVLYEILQKWQSQVKNVYQSLDVLDHFKQPALTMGATVAGLFEARLRRLLGCQKPLDPKKEIFYDLLGCDCTSEHLAGLTSGNQSGLHFLSKVGGGRAFNNAPITAYLQESCVDMDLAGAYSSVMQNQTFPVGGLPIQMAFKRQEQPTLREFFKRWEREMISGLWLAVISTPEHFQLSNGQDYFRSWTPPKLNKGRIDPKQGETKYFSHEFFNAQLTSHDLSYLYNDISAQLRNEILDNVIVNSAIIYPKSLVLTDVEKLYTDKSDKVYHWKVKEKRNSYIARPFYVTNMGDLVINELQAWREIYPKNGTPEDKLKNTLFKLFVNTTYGIAVSPYFKTANVVVGNNITAAVRRGAWCLEKGCNGQQSITDGGVFPINRVLNHRLEGRNYSPMVLFKTYEQSLSQLNRLHAELIPLMGGHTEFKQTLEGLKTIIGGLEQTFSEKAINERTLSHLQSLFPKEPLFNQTTNDMKVTKTANGIPQIEWVERKGILKFEMKTPVVKTTLHGTANYQLFTPANKSVIKMRSYTSKQHYGFELIEGELKNTTVYAALTVAEFFHHELMTNPHAMTLPPPYIIEKILKPKEYAKNPEKWHNGKDIDKAYPSWNVLKVGLLRPCTLSQFQFRTSNQWECWSRAGEKLKRKYGYSFELFFINDDGSLNYQAMIEKLDNMIGSGETNPIRTLTAYWKKPVPVLPTFTAWELLREKVKKFQEMDLEDDEDDDFDSEYERIMNNDFYD